MNLRKYLLDKIPQIAFSVFGIIIAFFMLNAFKVQNDLKFALLIIFIIVILFNILIFNSSFNSQLSTSTHL